MTTRTRKNPTQHRAAAVSSVDVEQRTFNLVWSTGAGVLRYDWWSDSQYLEELSLDPAHVRLERLNNGAPFLANHNTYDVRRTLGVVVPGSAKVDGKQGIATIRFAPKGVDPEADMVFEKIAAGIIRNISVGYRTWKEQETTAADEKVPTLRAIDWEPTEISAVAVGADAGAGVRGERPSEFHDCITHTTRGMPPLDTERKRMTEEEKKRAAEAEAEQKRQEEAKRREDEAAKIRAEAVAKERERAHAINHAVRVANLEPSLAESLVKEGVSVEVARERVLAAMEQRSAEINPTPGRADIEVGETDRQKKMRGMEAWLFEKSGDKAREVGQAHERKLKGFEQIDLNPGPFRGMTLEHVARECLEMNGVSTKGIYDRERIFKMAMSLTRSASGLGAHGTGDFNVLMENVLYKTLRAAFAVQADTWREWCGTDTVQDFRLSNRYMNGAFDVLPVVPEGEEYKNLKIPDGSKIQIGTEKRGAIIALTMESLINDDMGAVAALAQTFGRTAGRSIEKAAYELLLQNSGAGPTMGDGNPFFHTSRGNVGTSAAITGAALSADRQKMREQKDTSGVDFLDLEPRILLISPAVEDAARSINTDTYDHDSNKLQKTNLRKNMFGTIVSSPRLTGARRYLFTEGKEAFKAVFLEGSGEGPTMSMQEGFRVDGTEWKAQIFFKVNPYDPKTALTNAGT